MPDTDGNARLVLAFADRLNALDPEAWQRIAERCARLDQRTIEGFLGRAELFARSVIPGTDPYERPGIQPTMAAVGTLAGFVFELAKLLGPADPEGYERSLARIRERGPAGQTDRAFEGFVAVQAVAERRRVQHPGVAAALSAAALALQLRGVIGDAQLATVYSPFEPEIPYSSLQPAPGEHAA